MDCLLLRRRLITPKPSEASGTGYVLLPHCAPGAIASLKRSGACSQSGTPTPTSPQDIICNNGALAIRHESGLPIGYTLLQYIQTSGQAYIDTGVKTSLDTEIGAELAFDSASTQIVWANHENNTAAITCFITSNGSERFGSEAKPNSNTLQYITAGIFHNIKENKDGIYIDGTQRVQLGATDSFESPNSMYLLWCRNTSQASFGGKVKSAYIKQGGVYVRNYVPAKRDADDAIGLFDTVSNTFFANQGTGDFIAGSEASDPLIAYADGTPEVLMVNSDSATVADLLAVGDYEDTQELISGLVNRKVGVLVLDGTEEWTLATGSGYRQFYTQSTREIIKNNVSLVSTIAPYGCTAATRSSYDYGCYSGSAGNLCFQMIGSSTLTDLTAWENYLAQQYAAGTPVIVVYPLAIETTEQVAAQMLTTRPGEDNIVTSNGQMEITYRRY